MDKRKILQVIGVGFLFYLLLVSCQQSQRNETFIGYSDVIVNSPTLLWGSSTEDLKNKYPNVVNESGDNITFDEYNLNGKIWRFFDFIDNQLWRVGVSYGEHSDDELDLLRKDLQKKYGISLIEDNGTIEAWYLESNEYNQIVFLINKLENNTINCSYINPPLMDLHWKKYIYPLVYD
ncbi:MAG: hypothetical protein LBQ69_07160 [Treponema sp.]|jgi:hypothetical protein|nr:hypothetical protein [Treponema sp.]